MPFLVIGLATLLVWGHTVRFQFVWDDVFFIEKLTSIRSLANIPSMFTSLDAQSSYPEGFVLFRPLRTVHYTLLFGLGGGEPPKPWLFHLANILWHGLAAMLLYSVIRRLLLLGAPNVRGAPQIHGQENERARLIALIAGLGFAVAPAVSEVVCWAKSLDDAMAAVFTLAALRVLLEDWKHSYPAGLGLFLLAVYSKVSAVPFAAFVFFIFLFTRKCSFLAASLRTVPFLAVAFGFMVHSHLVVGRSAQTAPISGTYAQTLIDTLPAAATYLRLLWGVPPFHIDYTFMTAGHSMLSSSVLAGAALVAATIGWVVLGFMRERVRLASLGLAWLALFLLPVSNLMPMMQYMAERFLYLPLAGWFLFLAAVLWQIPARRTVWICSSGILLLWAFLAWDRSFIWKDELTLFVQSSLQGPKTPRVNENAVAAIFSLPHMKQVFAERAPGAKQFALAPAATVSAKTWVSVRETLQMAEKLFPGDENVLTALGGVSGETGDPAGAAVYFEELTRRKPKNPNYWANLARAQSDQRQFEEARASLDQALKIDPAHPAALRSLASVAWQQNDLATSQSAFERLRIQNPRDPEIELWLEKIREKLKAEKKP